MKKINGPTCKLTLYDIIIENVGIIFTNIQPVKTKNKVFNKSNTHVEGADLEYYASLWTAFLGMSSINLVSSPGQRPCELLPPGFVRRPSYVVVCRKLFTF